MKKVSNIFFFSSGDLSSYKICRKEEVKICSAYPDLVQELFKMKGNPQLRKPKSIKFDASGYVLIPNDGIILERGDCKLGSNLCLDLTFGFIGQ